MLAGAAPLEQTSATPDPSAAFAYIRSRQTPEGGFSFYRSQGIEEPAAADTFYALAALHGTEARPERPGACLDWLLDRQAADGGYSNLATAWYVSESLDRLGASPRRSLADWLAPYSERFFDGEQALDAAHDFLLNLWRYVELCERFELPLEARHRNALVATLKRFQDGDGAFPAGGATLPDSAIALRLMHAANLIAGRQILALARASEDATYGFRVARIGQSTSLDVLAAGLSILAAFNVAPKYRTALLRTVSACQDANGGFGHREGAIPTLRNTYLALFILKRIEFV